MFAFQKKKTRARKSDAEKSFARHILLGLFRFVLIGLIAVLTYYVTRVSFFTISEIAVLGGETIPHEDIRRLVEDELRGTYFLLIPRKFAYIYPHDRIKEVIEGNPRIHDVKVERLSGTTLQVTFDEYIPSALRCTDVTSQPSCYFLTDDGYAFAAAPRLEGGALTRHINEGETEIGVGQMLPREELAAIRTFLTRAEDELGLRIVTVLHKKNKDYEFSINGGGAIYAASGRDLGLTFDNLKSVMQSKEFEHLEPGNFQYVDVRFENKVFVNEKPVTVSTTTVETSELPLE